MKRHLPWLLPLAALLLFTPFTPGIDLAVARFFYKGEGQFVDTLFTRLMYRYGEWFGLAAGFAALVTFVGSYVVEKWRHLRKGALALTLAIIIGSGLITNVLLKEHWGRPRPKQVVEFGGKHPFRPCYLPDFHASEPRKSFPSGHTSVGFYYTSHILVGRRYKSRLFTSIGLFLTTFLGGGLMLCRMMMGAHFLSDTFYAALIMWLVALTLDRLLFKQNPVEQKKHFPYDSLS